MQGTLRKANRDRLSLLYLLLLVTGMNRTRRVLSRRPIRRTLEVAVTGTAVVRFDAWLAVGRRLKDQPF